MPDTNTPAGAGITHALTPSAEPSLCLQTGLLQTIHANPHIVTLTLNNGSALNALSTSVLTSLQHVLLSSPPTIILRSSHPSAFSAGGDIRALYNAMLNNNGSSADNFFRTIFSVVHLTDDRCMISIWNGIVMGGGVGISIHGRYRVATEDTIWAMPEVQIGFIPDVGASWFLSRLNNKGLAVYLGCTGGRLRGEEVYLAGLATHFVPSQRVSRLLNGLQNKVTGVSDVDTMLNAYHRAPVQKDIVGREIVEAMCSGSIAGIMNRLQEVCMNNKNEIRRCAIDTLGRMKKASPMSMMVTHEMLRRAKHCDTLQQCIQMEFRVAIRMIARQDYMHGIRCTIIDKSESAKWEPSTIIDISKTEIDSFFHPLTNTPPLQPGTRKSIRPNL